MQRRLARHRYRLAGFELGDLGLYYNKHRTIMDDIYKEAEQEHNQEHGDGQSDMVVKSDKQDPTNLRATTPPTVLDLPPQAHTTSTRPRENRVESSETMPLLSSRPEGTQGSIQEQIEEPNSASTHSPPSEGNSLAPALKKCYMKLCCPFGVKQASFIIALFIIVALPFFVTDLVMIGVKYGHSKDLVVRNDYVLLEANSSGLYSTTITFNNTNFTSGSIQPNMITYIYQIPCYDVYNLYKSQNQHQSLRVAFNACGIYINKCILDEYWYCLKSKAALMFYAFNFTSVNRREELKIAVFDDAVNYMSYLSGKKSLEGALYIRDVPTDTSYWEFDFTSARMRKEASYYFFVIVDLKGGTEPFLVTKNEIRTYFNASMILPNCKVNNNESCSSNITLTTHDSCFLAQAQGQYNASSYGSKDMVYVSYKLEYLSWSIFYIASLSLCGALVITCIVLCILKDVCC